MAAETYQRYSDTQRYKISLPLLLNHIVAQIPAKWEDVGLMLGINEGQLEAIKIDTSNGGNPNHYFKAVMKLWKTGNYAPFNWCTMLHVLSEPYINCSDIAKSIIENLLDKMPETCQELSPISPPAEVEHHFNDEEYTVDLTALRATNLLRESGFRTFTNWSKLACTLEVPLEDRKMLRQKGLQTENYNEILEEAIDIWIKNGSASWKKLIQAVEMEERNTAKTLRMKLRNL